MRLALAAGIAVSAFAFTALADELPRVDTNGDGWVTRAEASAMAENVFRQLDTNHDGKLDASDHPHDEMFEHHMHGGPDGAGHGDMHVEREVIIRRDDGTLEHDAPPAPPGPPGTPANAPLPPHPPGPPNFMMIIANSDEADRNGDHALSLEEFRAQHLRFFDASDVNGDGRIRFDPPPPPEAPEPPQPPAPPTAPR